MTISQLPAPVGGAAEQARPGCRPGCALLCTSEGMAAAYAQHRVALLARARAVLGDAAAAEDAVQEAFLRAWRACASFDPGAGPGAPLRHWLLVVVRNVSLDMLRARAARPCTYVRTPPEPAPGAGASATDRVLLRADLVAALARITPEHRAAVLGAVVRDRAYDDVAAELRVPPGTVRSRVHYGLRRLRAALVEIDADRAELDPAA
ncbi:MAG: RNA polymerase sigma factor [Pseudonocardia sp.]